MEGTKTRNSFDFGSRGGRGFSNRNRNILLGFCLTLVTITSGACAVAPALVLTTAAVSAVGVVTEGERLLVNVDEPNAVIVKTDTDIYTGPGEGYSRKGTLNKGDRIEVVGYQEGWIQCLSGQFDSGWIQTSDVPDI